MPASGTPGQSWRGGSTAKLAREAGEQPTSLTWRQLQRIAAGETTRPRPATARVLEQMFGYPIEQLLAPEPSTEVRLGSDDDWAEDMRRRALLGGAVIAGALSALDPVRRELDAAFGGPVTDHDAVEWERAAVSLLDVGQWSDAGRYWRVAERAARLSGDRAVSSLIGGRRAVYSLYAPGRSAETTLALADDALGWGGGTSSTGILTRFPLVHRCSRCWASGIEPAPR